MKAKWAKAAQAAQIEIPPDEVEAVTLFLSLGTQWREGFGGPMGLDYQAIAATASMLGIEVKRPLFLDLRAMEAAALTAWRNLRRRRRR